MAASANAVESRPAARPGDGFWVYPVTLVAVFAAYGRVISGGFGFIWDDSGHVTKPELRSLGGLLRIWIEPGATQQYYPVLHTAFWAEHFLWGDSPLGYHLVNLALHGAAACLLVAVLRRLAIPGAALAGLIFALHPVNVESAAWISEQKNTLSAVFYLSAAWAYLDFSERGGLRRYALATALFALALLSKSVAATLPGALLVIAWWRRGMLSWNRDVRPLVPWLLLGGAMGLFTAWIERNFIGAQGGDFALTFLQRNLLAGHALWFYLAKLVWPTDLAFVYPRWTLNPAQACQWIFPLGVIAFAAALWAMRGRVRAPLTAFLVFAGSLFPVLGYFNVYPFRYSFVADHFQYLACQAVFAFAAGAAVTLWPAGLAGLGRTLAGALLLVLGCLTWRQCSMYSGEEALYRATLGRNPHSWFAHYNLGNLLIASGRTAEAVGHFEAALRERPDLSDIRINLGDALVRSGRPREAAGLLREALLQVPDSVEAHTDLAAVYEQTGSLENAAAEYRTASRLAPGDAVTHYNLGNVFVRMNRLEEAVAQFRLALKKKPDDPATLNNLGGALIRLGRPVEAADSFERALRLAPGSVDARCNLASALLQLGRAGEAADQLEQALRLSPGDEDIRRRLQSIRGRSAP